MVMKVKVPLEGGTMDKFSDSGKDAHGMGVERQRMEMETRINHQGEVNRARMMPQKRNILATKTVSGELHIFDYFKHGTDPDTDEVKPQLRLTGHTKEGFGLSWNPKKEGHLLSGADDQSILIWDISTESAMESGTVKHTQEFNREHESVVEDVCWHKSDPHLFGSVSDDKRLKIWDTRQPESALSVDAHTEEALCLDFSPFNQDMLITGSVDKSVALWDRRNLKTAIHLFKHHSEEVNTVKYHPHHENMFASGSSDRRILVWDVTKCKDEQTEEEKMDGPPEMVFMHGGHTAKVTDMSWNGHERNMIASVAEDNIVQVWQMAREIVYDEAK